MNRWISLDDKAEWAALFTGFTTSAYRLEGQQIYSSPAEDEAVARVLAGQPHGLSLSWVIPKLRAMAASGRTQTRVRVVTEPPTDYTRFELSVYPELVAEGEDIRIISVPAGEWPAGLPSYDYWLFDDRDVWRMHYRDDYTFRGAELLEDEETITEHLRWRDIALAQAVPLRLYQAE